MDGCESSLILITDAKTPTLNVNIISLTSWEIKGFSLIIQTFDVRLEKKMDLIRMQQIHTYVNAQIAAY